MWPVSTRSLVDIGRASETWRDVAGSTPQEQVRGRRVVTVRPNRWTYWVSFSWTHPDMVSKPEDWHSQKVRTRTILTKRGVLRWIARRNRQYDQQLLEERLTFTVTV